MTTSEIPAALLRRAADRLDQLAAATNGDWWEATETYPGVWIVRARYRQPSIPKPGVHNPPERDYAVAFESDEGDVAKPDAAWMGALGPQVAPHLSSWLRAMAPDVEWRYDTAGYREALAFARIVLGETEKTP